MSSLQKNDFSLEFLRDDPISKLELDEFRHASVASTLESIVNDATPPLTIGLFADWGVGKSGVSSLLKSALAKDKKIACIEFDVWKYEDEISLRRQFLNSLDSQLRNQGKRGKSKLNERLNASISRDVDDGIKIDQAAFAKFLVVIAIILYVGIATTNQLVFGATALAGIIAVVGLNAIMKTGLAIFKNNKKTITESRLTDSDEFQQEFQKIVDDSDTEKIVVILDNLDRVTEEKAVTLLSTVKSFLEYGKCVYVVPCDEGAIKKHLRKTYNYKDGNEEMTADEFLRKFFNTYIRIPDFIDADLQVYTEKHLRQTRFDEVYPAIENLGTVITAAYRDNPRQIKQFINIFITHYLMAKKREEDEDMPPNEVTGNPEFLAKILIIQQKWPTQFKEILRGKSLKDAAGPDDYQTFLMGSSLTEEPLNIKSFLYYKRSQRASNLPPGAAEVLQTAAEDAKLEDIKSQIEMIQSGEIDYTRNLNDFFRELLEDAVRGNRRQIIINIIKSLNIVWLDKKFLLDTLLLQRINKAIKDNLMPEDLFAANETFVSHSLTAESSMAPKNAIAKKYIDSIGSGQTANLLRPESVTKVLNFVESNPDLFNTKAIQQSLSENLTTFVHDIKVIKQITTSDTLIKIIQPNFINEAVAKMTKTDADVIDDSTNLYAVKSELLARSPNSEIAQMNQYLESVRVILGEIFHLTDVNKYLEKIMPTFLDSIAGRKDLLAMNDNAKNIIDTLINAYNNYPAFEMRTLLLKPLLILRDFGDDAQKSNIQSSLNQQIAATVEVAEDFLTDPHFENIFDDVRNPLEDAAVNVGPFINVIWKYGDEDSKVSLIERLFTVSSNTALSFLEERFAENDLIEDKVRLILSILQQAKQASIIERQRYYELVAKIDPRATGSVRDEIVEHISELARQNDPSYQEQAEKLFQMFRPHLIKQIRKDLAVEILNWIEPKRRINSNLLPAIQIALTAKDDLNNENLARLYKIIFEFWILQETDENQIEIIRDQIDLNIPDKLRNEYYEKINERIAAVPQMTDSLNQLKDKMELDSKGN